jgi:EPTP domain
MPVTLTEVQRIPTWGARAVEPLPVGGHDLLAIPQLAKDIPGGLPGMNGGDSDTDLLLLNRAGGRFWTWATLPARDLDSVGVCPLRLTGTDTDMLYAGAAARTERFLK